MNRTLNVRSCEEITAWVSTEVAKVLEIEVDAVDPDQDFSDFGIDSIVAFSITGQLSEWIERELPVTLLWEYPTINRLAHHISDQLAKDEFPEHKSFHSG